MRLDNIKMLLLVPEKRIDEKRFIHTNEGNRKMIERWYLKMQFIHRLQEVI